MIGIANSSIPKDQKVIKLANEFGDTNDIINEMLKTYSTRWKQLEKFSKQLEGPTIQVTLLNLYNFVKFNITYIVDELGTQSIKTPSSIWWTNICDCKGYSIFIRSVLTNLNIKSQFKFASYAEGRDVTHVYVIVPKKNGGYTTMDGCMPDFNIEKPTVKKIIK